MNFPGSSTLNTLSTCCRNERGGIAQNIELQLVQVLFRYGRRCWFPFKNNIWGVLKKDFYRGDVTHKYFNAKGSEEQTHNIRAINQKQLGSNSKVFGIRERLFALVSSMGQVIAEELYYSLRFS